MARRGRRMRRTPGGRRQFPKTPQSTAVLAAAKESFGAACDAADHP
jgi:hypothetical protein